MCLDHNVKVVRDDPFGMPHGMPQLNTSLAFAFRREVSLPPISLCPGDGAKFAPLALPSNSRYIPHAVPKFDPSMSAGI